MWIPAIVDHIKAITALDIGLGQLYMSSIRYIHAIHAIYYTCIYVHYVVWGHWTYIIGPIKNVMIPLECRELQIQCLIWSY